MATTKGKSKSGPKASSGWAHWLRTHRPGAKAIAVLVALVGTYFIVTSLAATGAATLSLKSATGSVGLGSTFTVEVNENSGTDVVNAVQANLTYSTNNLQFVSIDYSNSGFSTQAQSTTAAGSITMARGATAGVSGDQLIAVITFKAIAIGTGAATVSFGCSYDATTCPNGNAIIRASDNTNILTGQTNGTYTVVDNTAPSVPSGLTVAAHSVTSVALSWTASTDDVGVTGYKIYRNGNQIGTSTTTSYTNTGLTPSTTYTYTVAAYDAVGNTSAQSVSVAPKTDADTTAPSIPSAPTQQSRTMTTMVLGWPASTDNVGVTGYKVYRNNVQIGTSATTSYSDTGLIPGTTYTYNVAAYDSSGNTSGMSLDAQLASAPDTSAPSAPTALSVTAKTATTVSLGWAASTDNVKVASYRVYRNNSSTPIATVTTNSYQNTGLSASTAYTYQVSAVDAAGNASAKSAVVATTTAGNGDLNGDGHVNIFDLSIFLNHWQQTGTGLPEDLNGDNIVNVFDLSIILNSYGS